MTRSQLAATLGAVDQSGLVLKSFMRKFRKKGFGLRMSQSTDCSDGTNYIQKQAQQESPAE